jgi:hypothetical protein
MQEPVVLESAMVHPSSKPVIIKQGRSTPWQNAELKALFFRLLTAALLPKCHIQLAQVLLAWLQGAPWQEP